MSAQVLVWKSKHCDYFYDASTPEKLEAAALLVLRTLIKDRWLSEPEPYEKSWSWGQLDQELLAVTDEQLTGLPGAAKKPVLKERAKRDRIVEDYTTSKREWDTIQRLINGEKPLSMWRNRRRYKDEEWAQILERIRQDARFADVVTRESDGSLLRPITAWSILQMRSGIEYENYELETLIDATASDG